MSGPALVRAALLAALALGAWAKEPPAEYGILLLAHGGAEASWDAEVSKVRDELRRSAPTELALGMADGPALQAAVDALQARGVRRIIAVPLFVNSRSEVLDHTRWALGLRERPSAVLQQAMGAVARAGHGAHAAHAARGGLPSHRIAAEPVAHRAALSMTPAFDDHPLIAEIVAERARALSREPARETLLLVGHGPVDDAADSAWLESMGRLAERARAAVGFRAALAFTIRDDSPAPVKAAAVERLRAAVALAGRDGGQAVVVPHLLARGGIEPHVLEALRGLEYRWDGKTLLPHPNAARWALESAERLKNEPVEER